MRPPAASPIRVLLAHEDPLFVEGMVSALQQDGRFAVVGAALDGRDLARQTRALRPSIVVLDVNFPGFGGRAALPSLRRASQQTRVIVMARSDRGLSREVVRAGARGFLLMNSPPPTFRQAVAAVHAGRVVIAADRPGLPLAEPPGLTAREREVLALVADGLSSREIAARLAIGPRTVETYREHLMDKLNAHSAGALVRRAFVLGLVKL